MWLVKTVLTFVAVYAALVGAMYLAQTWLLFPTWLAGSSAPPLPTAARRLELQAADGTQLMGVHLPPLKPTGPSAPILVGFGGNAWNADNMALYLHGIFSGADIVTFNYRGYRPSGGSPSAQGLMDDALQIHDMLAKRFPDRKVIAIGISLGSGIAAHLARERPLAGLILVTAFDSLAAVAREHYPWLPVRWLFRHNMEADAALAGLETPVALIAAERDSIIPPPRTEALRAAIGNLVLDRTIRGADHNDLFQHPDFVQTMQEALRRIETGV